MPPYIGFEGPIGAGKTTLAGLLGSHAGAAVVFEEVDGNEFLADFYLERERYALAMQLWFLMARHAQLANELAQDRAIVADYTFAKDKIFARTLLKERDLRLYDRIAVGLRNLRRPDLFVYLDATDDVLLERIARRGRPYEKPITSDYLDAIRSAYERYLEMGEETNVLKIDTTDLDLTSSEQMTELYRSILSRCR